jgi:hypothetical protein
MSYVNKTKSKASYREKAHLNFMGGLSYDVNPLTCLRMAAASCFFGEPMYYHRDEKDKAKAKAETIYRPRLDDTRLSYLRETLNALDPREWRGLKPSSLLEKAIDEALDYDFIGTLKLAVELRQEGFMRVTPQVILVRAAHHKDGRGAKATPKGVKSAPNPILEYASQILKRADEPATGLAYQLHAYGRKAIPNVLKKAWKAALERHDEYRLAKYRLENKFVKTKDVVGLVKAHSPAIDKLMKDELSLEGLTWEAIISKEGSNKDSWTKALDVMGHMALLRNIRNVLDKKVDASALKEKLVESAASGMQFPFRYYSAYKAVESSAPPSVLDAIEDAMSVSMGKMPSFNGRVMSLCDNSGSAQGATTSSMGTMQVSSIGNLSGVITGMLADDGYVGVFGDKLEVVPIRKRSSVFETTKKLDQIARGIGGGTENGIWLFWDKAIREKQHWDHVFVYSDMQAGHGGLYGVGTPYPIFPGTGNMIDVPKLINKYRAEVNPNVLVYLVQIAGYQDTIVPEFYNRTFILGGWGDGILKFAAAMSKQFEQKQGQQ